MEKITQSQIFAIIRTVNVFIITRDGNIIRQLEEFRADGDIVGK